MVRASCSGGDGDGKVIEFVFEFEDNTLGGLLADAGNTGKGEKVR